LKKVQIFYIRKFDSDRLKEANYKIKNLTYEQCLLNGEIINISDSQLVQTLFQITNRNFSEVKLSELQAEKKILSRKTNSAENRKKLKVINDGIDALLYIPEIISIQFKDKRHFQNIVKKGLFINGKEYVYFMASAGQTRRDQSLFIDKEIKPEIEKIFNNGRNQEKELVPQKYTAYYSLYSSSSQRVAFPRICVVPDVMIESKKTVNFSTYISPAQDPLIQEKTETFEFNGADGQGLMTPQYAKLMGQDLGVDYIPSAAIIRCSFMKGLLATFDIVKFANEISGAYVIKDIYGNTVDVRNIDIVISQSQFKLWDSYNSIEEYVSKCRENNIDFRVSRITPKEDKTFARSSYQFLQVLNFENEDDLKSLCRPTIDWLNGVSGEDVNSSLLFLLGDTNFENSKWFDTLDCPVQALLLENSLIKDSFFINYLDKNLVKKKNDAKLGRLIFNSNYSFMIADPYTQLSKIFGLDINPLLNEYEHYSKFWNDRRVKKAVGIRSPIVHASEIDVLNFQDNDEVNSWFKYINTGAVIFPLNGIGLDFVITGGADVDGDLICTINHESFIKGKPENILPVMYESKKAPKIIINESSENILVQSQINQVKSNKIGYYTNLASTYTSMLSNFDKQSVEYKTILNRLFYFRIIQGENIDSTKGLVVNPFLQYWVKYKKIKEDMTPEEIEYHTFNNALLAEKRPYFFVHLYSHYMRRYKHELDIYNNKCMTRYGLTLKEVADLSEKTEEQQSVLDSYYRRTFFIDNNSTMNQISHYMETSLLNSKKTFLKEFDYSVLLSKTFMKPLKRDIDKFLILHKEYKSLKRNLISAHADDVAEEFSSGDKINNYINAKAYKTITSNSSELADLGIYCGYSGEHFGNQGKNFVWNCFGKEIVENIKSRKNEKFVRVPMPNKLGNINYLWRNYGTYMLNIEE